MNTFLHVVALSSGVFLSSLAVAQSAQTDMGSQPMNKAEAAQMSQNMSPQARAQLSKREAHAAYKEAVKACKSMGQAERKGCMAEAKTNLRQDLSYAKEMLKPETSVGASGAGMSGTGAGGMSSGSSGASSGSSMSGASDLSTSGGSSGGSSASGAQSSSMQGGSQGSAMSSEPTTAAEKKQLTENFTPQAQYKLAQREAHAAYAEALKACKSMSRAERSDCTKEARATLKDDLAYAKRQMQEGSTGASGMRGSDSGMPGSGSK